jgi:hypothetical protein
MMLIQSSVFVTGGLAQTFRALRALSYCRLCTHAIWPLYVYCQQMQLVVSMCLDMYGQLAAVAHVLLQQKWCPCCFLVLHSS